MPLGLRNAPSTFQRLMDKFRRNLPDVCMLAYLDDLIILSSSTKQHLEDLRGVIKKLSKWNLRINREKTSFFCRSVRFLGHRITKDGFLPYPENVDAIRNRAKPTNTKQLISFLQMCSWYRRFIPEFARTSKPLSNLTKKGTPWKWSDDEDAAFKLLKEALIDAPVLRAADPTRPFTVRTDASAYAVGAVLCQGEGEEEHPVEYASRLLTPAERNYATIEKEALAIIWAMKKFRGYLDGSQITIATDHQPLRWLMNLQSPTGRLARWALQLQAYNIQIDYILGRANRVADTLSRPVTEDTDDLYPWELRRISIDMTARGKSDIREAQLRDSDLKKIIEDLEATQPTENAVYWSRKGYVMANGILYRYDPQGDQEDALSTQLSSPS